jgi:ubiquinone/menaquinone biosynthesis C-methylase UbiE
VSNVEVTTDAEGTVTGNTYDKYNTTNPVAKRLQAGFERNLTELFAKSAPGSLLDVGCGEAQHTHKWALELGEAVRVVGIDLEDATLQEFWKERTAPNLEYKILKAENMPFQDNEFEVATAIEVLEHVPDPAHTIAEMARVASKYLLVSVPREPIWRFVNVARGAYIKQLGNTPGHLNHWSKRQFVKELSKVGVVEEARSPFPWTMLLVRVHGA